MRFENNVEILELKTVLANGPGVIHPTVAWDEKDVILFDTGLPNMDEDLKEAAAAAGVPFHKLNHILITHSDMDHIGSLSRIIRTSERNITVVAHKEEKPYIECDLLPIRLEQMERNAGMMEGTRREQLTALAESLRKNYKMFRSDVNHTVEDGEVLPFCGGITCVFTPGHTPGHMCYYLNSSNLLIAGDLLQVEDNTLTKCPDFTVVDKQALNSSLEKLCRFAIKAVICYHGGLYSGDVNKQIAELARR